MGIKRNAYISVESFVVEQSSLEAVDIPSVPSLASDAPWFLSSQPTQPPQISMIMFAKDSSMTLESNNTIT